VRRQLTPIVVTSSSTVNSIGQRLSSFLFGPSTNTRVAIKGFLGLKLTGAASARDKQEKSSLEGHDFVYPPPPLSPGPFACFLSAKSQPSMKVSTSVKEAITFLTGMQRRLLYVLAEVTAIPEQHNTTMELLFHHL
jgi:hypothetical protein